MAVGCPLAVHAHDLGAASVGCVEEASRLEQKVGERHVLEQLVVAPTAHLPAQHHARAITQIPDRQHRDLVERLELEVLRRVSFHRAAELDVTLAPHPIRAGAGDLCPVEEHVGREAPGLLDEIPNALQDDEAGVPLVEMKGAGIRTERSQHAHAADAEDDLLLDARFAIAAVEAGR